MNHLPFDCFSLFIQCNKREMEIGKIKENTENKINNHNNNISVWNTQMSNKK